MTERQKRFVDNYIATGNATQAARQAGYSSKTARQIGNENLTKLDISQAVEERLDSMASEKISETQELLERLTSILRGEETEIIVTPSGKKFSIPARISDRLKAIEFLLKIRGMFKEKVDVKLDGAQLFVDTLMKVQAAVDAREKS